MLWDLLRGCSVRPLLRQLVLKSHSCLEEPDIFALDLAGSLRPSSRRSHAASPVECASPGTALCLLCARLDAAGEEARLQAPLAADSLEACTIDELS